jgi:hypothetical protein
MLSAPALKSDISPFRIAHTSAQTALDPKTSIQPQINKYVSFTGNSLRQFLAKHPLKFTQPYLLQSLRSDCRAFRLQIADSMNTTARFTHYPLRRRPECEYL